MQWEIGFSCAEKAFLYRVALHELKKQPFSAKQKVFVYRKLTNRPQKPLVFETKTPLVRTTFYCLQKPPFHVQKPFFCTSLSLLVSKTPIFTNQKLFFCTNLSLLPSKAILFCSQQPIPTTLNLLFAKNTAVLLISALTPYAVKPEPRTDSNHCRRYPENCCFLRCRLPDERRSFSQKYRIDRRFESWVAGLRPVCFLVTFCTTQKVTTRSPSQEAPRFCKPRFSPPQ